MDKINYIEKNLKIRSYGGEPIPFILDEQQKLMLQHLEQNDRSVITSARQCGTTMVGAAFAALELSNSTNDKSVKMAIICRNLANTRIFLEEVCWFLQQIDGFDYVSKFTNMSHIGQKTHTLNNGAEIYVLRPTIDAFNGIRCTHIITDNAGEVRSLSEWRDVNFLLAEKIVFITSGQPQKQDVVNFVMTDERFKDKFKHFNLVGKSKIERRFGLES